MKLCWMTDIHLNFLEEEQQQHFYRTLAATHSDGFFITGDIAEAHTVGDVLTDMADILKKPIYFVLGNHDYYHGSVIVQQLKILKLSECNQYFHWLRDQPVQLHSDTVLVGVDGWADGRNGGYVQSPVVLNDSKVIHELSHSAFLGREALLRQMQLLADNDAVLLSEFLTKSVEKNNRIIILTHVPPFVGACWYKGKVADDDWLPFFSSKATGDVIMKFAKQYPKKDFLVLCGHSHSEGIYQPRKNLLVKTGKAEYAEPAVQEILTV